MNRIVILAGLGAVVGLGALVWWNDPPLTKTSPPEIHVQKSPVKQQSAQAQAPAPVPHHLKTLDAYRYNVVAFDGKLYGLPWGLDVDWSQPPEAGSGVLIKDRLDALERHIAEKHARQLAASKPTRQKPIPQKVEVLDRYRYNVVAFDGKIYGLPWGLEVDWSSPPEPGVENGVLIDGEMERLRRRIREHVLTHIDWDREGAWIVEAIDDYRYNIVVFEEKLYALPWGLEVDWTAPPQAGDDVFTGTDAKALEIKIEGHLVEASRVSGRPQLLAVLEDRQYKLYVFSGNFYAVPVGIHMDFEEGALPAGVLRAKNMERLKTLIRLSGAK